ncbi:FprA family A-type flavoprotein [Clostridium folliculivorans]|uniref:MBL fold hydrolase n=1 Tax=Clostridium folliculivorans TaxID=2886038 RepID=A0A9W5Y2Y1_9CLOT|nr:FprA family A-type flavoprotein [Clostridium folliculivorans]GKU25764.1 MBL fold hydrolase [Clostridium folliculivorans]GKU28785.1 MBL fold hydrolase [Clostridium folliculivorans]
MINKMMIAENIYSVGKVDDRDVPFHRLTLTKGTTYNSYLLNTEKPTIIDTVDISFGKEFVDNLKETVDLMKIQYIVINHTEPDHSGGLGSLAAQAKNATIVCTEKAVEELKEMYKLHKRNFLVVKDGDKLDIGGKTLLFLETPYLHTEETMITYCIEDKILFPCDIFSTHIANTEVFNDLAKEDIFEDFNVYYTLIMHPHRKHVQYMINKIKDLDINMIAPSHGYILRTEIEKFVGVYANLSKNTTTNKSATVIYSTMTSNTKKLSQSIADFLNAEGITAVTVDVNKTPKEEVLDYINSSDIILFGSSTRYGDMIGSLEDVLKELKAMDLSNKIVAAFGSYGWSGESIEVIQDYLVDTNANVLETSKVIKSTGMSDVAFPIRIRFTAKEESLQDVERACEYIGNLALNAI